MLPFMAYLSAFTKTKMVFNNFSEPMMNIAWDDKIRGRQCFRTERVLSFGNHFW